jgi:predicted nucleic acid-binding protein
MNGTALDRVSSARRIHLDTAPLIYFMEEAPRFLRPLTTVFEWIDEGRLEAISSYITLIEVLVKPLREGDAELLRRYRDVLTGSRNLALYPLDGRISESTAKIRARYEFRLPDAIQLATALYHRADAFLTNDKRLKRFEGIDVIVLGELDDLDSASPV